MLGLVARTSKTHGNLEIKDVAVLAADAISSLLGEFRSVPFVAIPRWIRKMACIPYDE